jgi:Fur family ferric uptake transcriptional regulator
VSSSVARPWPARHARNAAVHEHAHEPPPAAVLRARGRRLTPQRARIWEVLTATPDAHLSAEEVAERVRDLLPELNASTVYRTLEVLVDEGLVLRTDLGRERAYFEPAHEHRHHHLVCERCGRVEHVHDDVLSDLAARLTDRSGFRLGDRELTLLGRCAACAGAG